MRLFSAVTLVALLFFVIGCEKDPHTHDDTHKVPGTFILTLTSTQGDTLVARWRDFDGPGGSPPIVDTLTLRASTTYSGLLNIIATDGDSLTNTIRTQGTEHQFFYSVEGSAENVIAITIRDRDSRGMPLGLETQWTVSAVQAPTPGAVRIKLYHYEPNKKDGQTPSPETDADISIPLIVQP